MKLSLHETVTTWNCHHTKTVTLKDRTFFQKNLDQVDTKDQISLQMSTNLLQIITHLLLLQKYIFVNKDGLIVDILLQK